MRHFAKQLAARFRINQPRIIVLAVSFIALVFASATAITGWRTWSAYDYHLEKAQANTSNLARALAQHAEDTFKSTDISLLNLVERVESDGTSPGALRRLHRLFAQTTGQFPQFQGMFVFDSNGRYIASAQNSLPANVTIADREYFRYHRANPSRETHVSVPVRSRTLGKWMIPVSRRINNVDGSFKGVVLITIEMDYFIDFYGRFDIGSNGLIVLMLDNGIHVARRPFTDEAIGKRVQNGPFAQGLFNKLAGSFVSKSTFDGTKKVYGYRHLEDYPFIAVVALAKHEVLAEWRNEVLSDVMILILLATILGFLAYRLIRQIAAQIQTEQMLLQTQRSLHELNHAYESLAMQDGLTGLANRRHFDQVLQKEFKVAKRLCAPLSLLMIDVDCFKHFNDLYGHPAGDACLKAIAHHIRSSLYRPADFPARYGGEEFIVLLPNTSRADAMAIADRLRLAISELRIAHTGNATGVVTISLGVSTLFESDKVTTPDDLIDSADKALYQAKKDGKNLVLFSLEAH